MKVKKSSFMFFVLILGALALAIFPLFIRSRKEKPRLGLTPPPVAAAPAREIAFTEVTEQAGITFRHNSGAFGKKYLPETMGSGCAFFDYDGDGRQDILLVNSMDFKGHKRKVSTPKLYRNLGDGTFEDVTGKAGLAVEMYGMGAAAADYDNDGDNDLYITCLGQNHLFRNKGNGIFTDITNQAGVECPYFSTSAAFLDYDKDGDLDLFVCNYVKWSPQTDIWCTLDGKSKAYCTPERYPGESCRLYRNEGKAARWRFKDVTKEAGIFNPQAKALGVAILDYNNDGFIDIAVANDTVRNFLFHNNGDGTFKDVGVESGMAYSEAGLARAGMGIDAADYDGCGRESLIIANFSNEMVGLYHNEGHGLFVDMAPPSGLGQSTLLFLSFGCFFFDADLDGLLDLFIANGHIEPEIEKVDPYVTYRQRPLLFWGRGKGNFIEAAASGALKRPIVGRGAAYADYDSDGDLDLLLTENNGPAVLLRNDGGSKNHWLRIKLIGTKSNRNGVGCKITVKAGDLTQMRMIRSGSSYCSQSELIATFGLGAKDRVDLVEVHWTSGEVTTKRNVDVDRLLVIQEESRSTATHNAM